MAICEICKCEFIARNEKKPSRTCSKKCKNELARNTTIRQFSDPAARELQRKISLEKKKDPEYQKRFQESMDKRNQRWAKEGYPRTGTQQPESAKQKIGNANRGKFKGKTWEEIYGKEVAERRRVENSLAMSKLNEILLKEKRSSLEERLIPYLKGYENNVQVSYYNVDFINKETAHIIEVYGDYWHCNPRIYPDNYMHPYFKMTAQARRKLDEDRLLYLKSLGYSITIVWESDMEEFIGTLK